MLVLCVAEGEVVGLGASCISVSFIQILYCLIICACLNCFFKVIL